VVVFGVVSGCALHNHKKNHFEMVFFVVVFKKVFFLVVFGFFPGCSQKMVFFVVVPEIVVFMVVFGFFPGCFWFGFGNNHKKNQKQPQQNPKTSRKKTLACGDRRRTDRQTTVN
jgi:hypothetical protein